MKWEVDFHDDFVPEYRALPKDVQDELLAHLGGSLSLVPEFPDRSPVVLSGIAEEERNVRARGRKHAHA